MNGLQVSDLSVAFDTPRGRVAALDDVHLSLAPGRMLGIVGESGSGKTTLARALMRHLPGNGRVLSGSITMNGRDLLRLGPTELRRWRRDELAVVHQEAGGTLDPTMRIGTQLAEVLELQGVPAAQRHDRVIDLLTRVRLPRPEALAQRYPHQLSGGQQQRVVIAAALATQPSLVVLDEPTTGLDASVQAQVLGLLDELRHQLEATMVLISHDITMVGQLCDDIAVMYSGRVVEHGTSEQVLHHPRHPYTAALLNSVPRLGVPRQVRRLAPIPGAPPDLASPPPGCRFAPRCAFATDECRAEEPPTRDLAGQLVRCVRAEELELHTEAPTPPAPTPTLMPAEGPAHVVRVPTQDPPTASSAGEEPAGQLRLDVRELARDYAGHQVIDGVNLHIRPSEVFGLVGESGSGKTTLARAIMGIGPSGGSGSMSLSGTDLPARVGARGRGLRRRLQMVFQQADDTLNPRHRVRTVLARALTTLRGGGTVESLARQAQLDPALLDSSTARLSGGQKQRVAIARAFAGGPELVVCDEPVSALDVSVQAGVLEVLATEREQSATSYLFISHDLAVVGYLADRIAVMYRGELVEVGPSADVLAGPHHPYTAALVAASLRTPEDTPTHPERLTEVGCRFADRCPFYLGPQCSEEHPGLSTRDDEADRHSVRCHLPSPALPSTDLTQPTPGRTS